MKPLQSFWQAMLKTIAQPFFKHRFASIAPPPLRLIPASDRLEKTGFQADEDWNTYPRTEYRCPACGETVSFCMRDFERHSLSYRTNFYPDVHLEFNAFVQGKTGDAKSFLDFYCPGCQRPVRLYYQVWAGGRWTHGYHIHFIVEWDIQSPYVTPPIFR
jgi:hypothetical protein